MKEMLKKIAVICIVGMFVSGCTPGEENPKTPTKGSEEDKKINEVVNYENVDKQETALKSSTMQSFNYGSVSFLVKTTKEEKTLTGNNISEVLQYKYILESKEGKYTVTHSYIGIYLEDLIEELKVEKVNSVLFKTANGSTLSVPAADLEGTLLVFGADGQSLREWGPIKVVVPTYDNNTWLETVNYIEFK